MFRFRKQNQNKDKVMNHPKNKKKNKLETSETWWFGGNGRKSLKNRR